MHKRGNHEQPGVGAMGAASLGTPGNIVTGCKAYPSIQAGMTLRLATMAIVSWSLVVWLLASLVALMNVFRIQSFRLVSHNVSLPQT